MPVFPDFSKFFVADRPFCLPICYKICYKSRVSCKIAEVPATNSHGVMTMPISPKMSWEPKARRWWGSHNNKRYVVSCRQLNAPQTKEGSYQAANAWWEAKKAELDGQHSPHPYAFFLADLSKRLAWATRHSESQLASLLNSEIVRIKQGGVPLFLQEFDPSMLDDVPPPVPFHTDEKPPDEVIARETWENDVASALNPLDEVWNDRIANENLEAVPADKTVGRLVKMWLSPKQTRVELDDLCPKGYDNTVDCVNHFRDWIGSEAAATVIDANRWQAYWLYLSGKVKAGVWKRDHARKVFQTARNFVEFLSRRDLIPLPKNLHDREFRFGRTTKEVTTMTVEEVPLLVENGTGQLPLHLLLMANCGMTQKDISDIGQDQVDWDHGRIKRKRSKTKEHVNVPTVDYMLWPLTWELLKAHRATEGERALLTRSGRPWVWSQLVDGELKSADNIASNYTHLQLKLNFNKPLKLIRKTSATLLGNSDTYRDLTGYFLGHAPRGMQERHYVATSQARFDEAITWLGRQYGFVS